MEGEAQAKGKQIKGEEKKKIYKWMGKTKKIGAEPDERKVMKEDGGKRKKLRVWEEQEEQEGERGLWRHGDGDCGKRETRKSNNVILR